MRVTLADLSRLVLTFVLTSACSNSGPLLLEREDRASQEAARESRGDAGDASPASEPLADASDAEVPSASDSSSSEEPADASTLPGEELADASTLLADAGPASEPTAVQRVDPLTSGLVIPEDCEFTTGTVNAPRELRCTGLFEDVAEYRIASGARPFSPGTELWSDGSVKSRWVYLPPGAVIDGSDPDEWDFPVGTRFWKEFVFEGMRIETRYFEKIRSDRWARGVYLWNAEETAAMREDGGHEDYRGLGYTVPSTKECDECHNGRKDRILGFDLFGIAEQDARGVRLQDLLDEGSIDIDVRPEEVQLPDELDPVVRDAMSWIHVNCGSACHNRSSDSEAQGTDLFMRLEYEQLRQLRSSNLGDLDTVKNTIGVGATTKEWVNEVRVVPGQPEQSLLFRLVSSRGDEQMPPLVSNVTSQDGVERIRKWIVGLAGEEE